MSSDTVQVGSIVRAVTVIGPYRPRIVYATVLAINAAPEHVGKHGHPSLTLAYLDNADHRRLGGIDWHSQLKREFGVRHITHEDVERRLTSVYWLDALPAPGEEVELERIRVEDVVHSGAMEAHQEKRVEHHTPTAPPVPSPVQTAASVPLKAIVLEHTVAQHAPDSIVFVSTTNGERRQVKMADLEPHNYLPDLKLTITERTYEEGVLYFKSVQDATPESEPETGDKGVKEPGDNLQGQGQQEGTGEPQQQEETTTA